MNPFLVRLTRNIKKLGEIWAKFKTTPSDVAFLVRDLSLLSQLLTQSVGESQVTSQILPAFEAAIRSCIDRSQELVELSSKFTGRLSRRPLTADNLKNLVSLLADSKIKFLMTQLLLERRTKPVSQTALAEELAQLHGRDVQAPSPNVPVNAMEPKTDSLLSFKCYSELVGREDILLSLDKEYEDANILALVGPDGVGKTQIATEYALRFQNRHPDSHVMWVCCESSTAFEECYRTIAVKLGIPGCEDSGADMLERVRRFLNQERAGKWLLILDNVDDAKVLWEHQRVTSYKRTRQPARLGTYLPSSASGQTLCLSTDERIGTHFPDTPVTLSVSPLPEAEATTLFQSKLPKELDHPRILAGLAGVLDNSPLSICLAAAYMVMMRRDAAHYLMYYKTEAPSLLTKGLSRAGSAATEESLTKSSFFRAWALSFDQVQRQHPQAANLLALMAMFHHRAVPKNLLFHAWKHGLVAENGQRSIPDVDIELLPTPPDLVEQKDKATYTSFLMALATLESFLIVQYDAGHEAYSMHCAIQSSIRNYLQCRGSLRSWRSIALILLSTASQTFRPPQKPHTRSRSNLLLHIAELIHHPHEGDVAGLAKARILSDVGGWRYSLSQTGLSTSLLQGAYDLQSQLLKPQDGRTLRTLVSLAESKSISESPSAAVPLLVEAIGGLKHTLGPGNRKTIFAQLSLCAGYVSGGEPESASTVHYEAQAAASASLQITSEDRKRAVARLSELRTQINILLSRQGKRSLSESDLRKSKSRVGALKHGARSRIGPSSKAFSTQSRVASLDSIVEMMEVEASRT